MSSYEQVQVIGHGPPAVLAGLRADQLLAPARGPASQHRRGAPRKPHRVIPAIVDATSENLYMLGHAGDYTHCLCQIARFPCRPQTALPSQGA
jgi:hypothetical protein